MVPSTTIKVSVETRERLRSLGGATYEATVIEALDALDAARFWAEADAAVAWRNTLPAAERRRRAAQEAELDERFEGVD